jgi:hypothetical protein
MRQEAYPIKEKLRYSGESNSQSAVFRPLVNQLPAEAEVLPFTRKRDSREFPESDPFSEGIDVYANVFRGLIRSPERCRFCGLRCFRTHTTLERPIISVISLLAFCTYACTLRACTH